MNTAIPSEPGPLEEMMRVTMVMHEALTGNDARRGFPVACVE